MAAFLDTLEPVDILFLATALMSALDFLVWTFWCSLKGGIGEARPPLTFEEPPSSRVSRIFRAVFGFMMMFGVAGLALRRLLEVKPLWALFGAFAAGAIMGAMVWSLDE